MSKRNSAIALLKERISLPPELSPLAGYTTTNQPEFLSNPWAGSWFSPTTTTNCFISSSGYSY